MRYSVFLWAGFSILTASALMLWGSWRTLYNAGDTIRKQLTVSVFLQSSVPDADAQSWGGQLQGRDDQVESITFISKQQAFEDAQSDPALARSLMLLKTNPFPAAYLIRYRERAWIERADPALGLKASPEIQDIRWDGEARSLFVSLRKWRDRLLIGAIGASAFAVLWPFAVRFRALRTYAQ